MNDFFTQKFAERLKELRATSKISQDKLADDVGYSQSAIVHWEYGKREPSIEVILNFANYFNVSINYMLGISDSKEPFNENIKSSFHERLKELRSDNNLSQSKLAQNTELSQSSITAWENQINSPKISALITLANYFNVVPEYLLGIGD